MKKSKFYAIHLRVSMNKSDNLKDDLETLFTS